MSSNQTVKLVVYVPISHADVVRRALGDAGAGRVGDYTHCSFSLKGTGRYIPQKGAHPTIGQVGKCEEVAEERIETVCLKKDLQKIIRAMKKVHPYEEIAYDLYPLESNPYKDTYNEYVQQNHTSKKTD